MTDHSLIVCAACTRRDGLLNRYESQLEAAGIPFHLEPLAQAGVGSLGVKIALLRKLATKFKDYGRIVLTDAWDVLFYGSNSQVLEALSDDHMVTLGAERNCFPDAYLAEHFWGTTPWKFFNGGFTAGSPTAILDWCKAIEGDECYLPMAIDQQWINWTLLSTQRGGFTRWIQYASLDRNTQLCYTMMREQGTLELKGNRLYNPICDSHPQWIHFNGNSGANLWPAVEAASFIGVHLGIIDSYGDGGDRTVTIGIHTPDDYDKLVSEGIFKSEVTA